ncbi:MAG: HEAT repeat domain-containing protein, partial [Planctomycetes bacterium]|nr:HEAT repeat domain-containing protein [Planctomycetota bacterium]
EALAQCREHDDQNMRMVTIETLGKLGGPKARAAIKTRLDDENEMIRRWAKMTLKKLEDTENK